MKVKNEQFGGSSYKALKGNQRILGLGLMTCCKLCLLSIEVYLLNTILGLFVFGGFFWSFLINLFILFI